MRLSDSDYEDAYAEALVCLADDGHSVSQPFFNSTGTRYCDVDGQKFDDEQVLQAWWQDEITQQILEGRTRVSP